MVSLMREPLIQDHGWRMVSLTVACVGFLFKFVIDECEMLENRMYRMNKHISHVEKLSILNVKRRMQGQAEILVRSQM